MPTGQSVSLDEFARSLAPRLNIVSISHPVPVLRHHNLVVLATDAGRLREAVLDLEAVEASDNHLASVVMGTGDESDVSPNTEGVGRVVGSRLLTGALLGGVIGAAIAAVVAAVVADAPTAGVAALGGAILGGAFGAIWTAFAGMGGSDAYRQSFVNEDITDLHIATLHTDDALQIHDALTKLPAADDVKVLQVDEHGNRTDNLRADERPS